MGACDGSCAHREEYEQRVWPLVAAALLLAAGLVLEFQFARPLAARASYGLAALIAGPEIFGSAWRSLRQGRMGMSFLMSLAAVGAFVTGHGEEGAAVLLLFSIAEELEAYSETRATSSIRKLLELAPLVAAVRRDGLEIEVPTDQVEVGETVVLRPGEKVPLDGTVVKGGSSVDQSAITGESVPVDKAVGSQVFAASLVNEGYLEIAVTKRASETLLARIVELVGEARANEAPTEQFVERFARVYTPTVVAVAVAVAILPPLVFAQPFMDWLYRALVLLVVSCPCALAISTPVSFVSGLTAAARHGVLIKGAVHLEAISKASIIALDKTGTLTKGTLEVTSLESLEGPNGLDVMPLLAGIESRSQHPIAAAIVRYTRAQRAEPAHVEDFASQSGRGVSAKIDETVYRVASPDAIRQLGLTVPEEQVETLQDAGKTVVLLASPDRVLAWTALADEPRANAAETVRKLRSGKMRIVMLTGDAERTARAVAAKVGVDEVRAELLPEDKVTAIRELARLGDVIMVGDGVNDAPALAQASVGIAMGAAGTDVAIETADIALMDDDLSKLPYLVRLSGRTMRVVRQNIILALGIKGTLALLSIPGWVSLWVAIGDMGLSLLVIANALRIGRGKSPTGRSGGRGWSMRRVSSERARGESDAGHAARSRA